MANRNFHQFRKSYEKEVVDVYGRFTVGAVGAVSNVLGIGISGVVRNSAGNYTITFVDSFDAILNFNASIVFNGASAAVGCNIAQTITTFKADVKANKTLTIQFVSATATAIDPDASSLINFTATFRNSSYGPSVAL
jgi:hypothetical protein